MKNILISIILFLVTTIMHYILVIVINEELIARLIFGVDLLTYINSYYVGQEGLLKLVSGTNYPYEWLFNILNYVMALVSVIMMWLTLKGLKKKYIVNKKDFAIIMIIFSILSLYIVPFSIFAFGSLPFLSQLIIPMIFIIAAYIGINKLMYKK